MQYIRYLKIFVGLIFVISGFGKLISPIETFEYIFAYLPIYPDWVIRYGIWIISIAELILGYVLIAPQYESFNNIAVVISLLLATFFLGLDLGRALLGSDGHCGCFGVILNFHSPIISFLLIILLFISTVTISIKVFMKTIRIFVLGSIIPLITVGFLVVGLANQSHEEFNSKDIILSPHPNHWYSLFIDINKDENVLNDISNILSNELEIGNRIHNTPVYPIINGKNASWLVAIAIPLTFKGTRLLKIALVYNSNFKLIKHYTINYGPFGTTNLRISFNHLISSFIDQSKGPFINMPTNLNDLSIPQNVIKQISHVMNITTNQLINQCYE